MQRFRILRLVRIVGGKIAEEWEEYDALGMMQQLGATPSMAKTEDKVAG
jgi:hypothetical protein